MCCRNVKPIHLLGRGVEYTVYISVLSSFISEKTYSVEGKKCNQIYGIIAPHSTFGIGNGELYCHF